MKKVLFLVPSLNVGGLETYLLRFLKSRDDIKSTIVCKKGFIGQLEDDFLNINSELVPIKVGFLSIGGHFSLYRFIKEGGFDTVCDFTGDFSGLSMLFASIAGINKRLTFYRGSENQYKSTFLKDIYVTISNTLVSIFSTKILANSTSGLNKFHPNLKKGQGLVIKNGIPDIKILTKNEILSKRKELGIAEDMVVIGHVGRFSPAKNHPMIIDIANQIDAKMPLVFYCCGNDVVKNMEKLLYDTLVGDRFILNEARSDVLDVMQCFDVFLFPSLNEGHPNALLEAMYLGKPFVSSNIDSILETIPKNLANQLSEPKDIDQFCKLLTELIDNVESYDSDYLSSYIKENFDSNRLFDNFYQEL